MNSRYSICCKDVWEVSVSQFNDNTAGSEADLFVVPDTVLATESLLLPIDDQKVVGRRPTRQVISTLLTAVHDQAVGHAVAVEAHVTTNLVGDILKADFMANLQGI